MGEHQDHINKIREKNRDEKKYSILVEGARLVCSKGDFGFEFTIKDEKKRPTIGGKRILNVNDKPDSKKYFKDCEDGGKCYFKVETPWANGHENVLVDGKEAMLNVSENICSYGGELVFADNGQEDD